MAEFDVGMTSKSARAATDPNGPTGRLATWLADTKLADVPPSVRDHAKHLLLDGIACALVGAQLPVSRKGVEGVTALDNAGSALLIGWGGRSTSAPSAAMLNSSFIQGFELDDYHPLAPLHSNSSVMPAMLAAAPHVGRVSGARFLLGAILGYETGRRLARRPSLEMLPRLALGCCLSARCRLPRPRNPFGLDAAVLEDALGIAATQSCGLMSAQFRSMVANAARFASRNGLTAAACRATGYVGIKRVFERVRRLVHVRRGPSP
jgi:2-methylcitrate dehydratase PrpD